MHGFDPERGGLAELTDVFHPEPVDVVGKSRSMQFVEAGYLRDFGGVTRFSGPASTVLCFENNPLVREALNEPGRGRVLVVDGGGSRRCALMGDNLASLAFTNGWAGVVINGCLRDAADIGSIPIGVKAIATHPLKSSKRDPGVRDVPVTFAGVTVTPGDWVYADMDGVIVGGKEKFELR
jgi:RraA family protein